MIGDRIPGMLFYARAFQKHDPHRHESLCFALRRAGRQVGRQAGRQTGSRGPAPMDRWACDGIHAGTDGGAYHVGLRGSRQAQCGAVLAWARLGRACSCESCVLGPDPRLSRAGEARRPADPLLAVPTAGGQAAMGGPAAQRPCRRTCARTARLGSKRRAPRFGRVGRTGCSGVRPFGVRGGPRAEPPDRRRLVTETDGWGICSLPVRPSHVTRASDVLLGARVLLVSGREWYACRAGRSAFGWAVQPSLRRPSTAGTGFEELCGGSYSSAMKVLLSCTLLQVALAGTSELIPVPAAACTPAGAPSCTSQARTGPVRGELDFLRRRSGSGACSCHAASACRLGMCALGPTFENSCFCLVVTKAIPATPHLRESLVLRDLLCDGYWLLGYWRPHCSARRLHVQASVPDL